VSVIYAEFGAIVRFLFAFAGQGFAKLPISTKGDAMRGETGSAWLSDAWKIRQAKGIDKKLTLVDCPCAARVF
jgi:hypothetical protein